MKEIIGNIWSYHSKGYWVVITTNGNVKANGEAVMGRGIALQAAKRFPELPKLLGDAIKERGNVLHHWGHQGLLLFPTKNNWWEDSDLALIEQGAKELQKFFDEVIEDYPSPIYLPRVGCANGHLDWKDVKPILEKYLDDRFVVITK